MKTASINKENMETFDENVKPSCLRNEEVIVRFTPRLSKYKDKNEVLYGGICEGCTRTITVPMTPTGSFAEVLSKDEKNELENLLGVNLSSYNLKDNFWVDYNVVLDKKDTVLNLSDPYDFIAYKVLLSNESIVAPSKDAYDSHPLVSYEYMITSTREIDNSKTLQREMKEFCHSEIQKLKTNNAKLKTVFEMLNAGVFISDNISKDFILNKLYDILESDSKKLYNTLNDKSLNDRLFINECIAKKLISRIGDFYYVVMNKSKIGMSTADKDPTIVEAIKFLQSPKNSKIKIELEAMLQKFKDEERILDNDLGKSPK